MTVYLKFYEHVTFLHVNHVAVSVCITGKSTVVEWLKTELSAKKLQTPPVHMLSLRHKFDNKPDLLRRLYYSVGNYAVSQEICQACQTQPVVMDR